jgi:hypothetical protein
MKGSLSTLLWLLWSVQIRKDMAHVHFWGWMSLALAKDEFMRVYQFALEEGPT